MLRLEVSVCQKTSYGKHFIRLAGYNHATSSDCYGYYHLMRHLENSRHLIFREGLEEHTGGGITGTYSKHCPVTCRNCTFILLVLKRRQNRIEEYTLGVGNTVFIGFSHDGFRLTVQPPMLPCKCDMHVKMASPRYKIIKKINKRTDFWRTTHGDIFYKQ